MAEHRQGWPSHPGPAILLGPFGAFREGINHARDAHSREVVLNPFQLRVDFILDVHHTC